LRQLAVGTQIYTADNEGRLPDNNPGSTNDWVRGNLLMPGQATNQILLQQGKLFPYANHASTYHCPADRSQTNGVLRVRSYSMNGWVGSRYMNTYARPTAFRTFLRDSELAAVGPANIWLMLDEHELSINDAWFLVTMDDSRPFASFPATRHGLAYDLSFADGHIELIVVLPLSLLLPHGDSAHFYIYGSDQGLRYSGRASFAACESPTMRSAALSQTTLRPVR
jgi:hypothetical protein